MSPTLTLPYLGREHMDCFAKARNDVKHPTENSPSQWRKSSFWGRSPKNLGAWGTSTWRCAVWNAPLVVFIVHFLFFIAKKKADCERRVKSVAVGQCSETRNTRTTKQRKRTVHDRMKEWSHFARFEQSSQLQKKAKRKTRNRFLRCLRHRFSLYAHNPLCFANKEKEMNIFR